MTAHLRNEPFERLPEPPEWVPAPEAEWWRAIVRDFELTDADLVTLEVAVGALVRWRQARELVDDQGLLVEGRYGLRQNPAVGIERDARLAALRALRELDLDGEPLPAPRIRRVA